MSPAPRPATSRPARSTVNVGARPAIAEPAAISSWPAKSDGSGPLRSDQTPARTMPSNSEVSMNENARPYDRTASRSLATAGIAVEMAMASNAMIVTRASSATVNSRYADPMGPPGTPCCRSGWTVVVTGSTSRIGALRPQPDRGVCRHQPLRGQRATGHEGLGACRHRHRLGSEVGDDQDALASGRFVDQSHDVLGVPSKPAQRTRTHPVLATGRQQRVIELES